MLVRDLIRKKSRLAKQIWIALFDRRNIEKAEAVHVHSEIESHELEELGFKPRRIVLVPNGIDCPINVMSSSAPASTSAATQDRPFILFLGRVNWEKGLHLLISAMTHVHEADLIIAGNDEENYKRVLVTLARELGVMERVKFLDAVDDTAKWNLLRMAQMLVLPSYSESFGNVVLEAMCVGRPVIVTPGVGLAPTVRAANAGLVVEGVPEKLAAAINGLLRDPDRCTQMGEAGRRVAKGQFSWDAIAQKMERVYEQCIGKNKNGG
jgi:glycosyltransferase involved in cell wall biosynthesis